MELANELRSPVPCFTFLHLMPLKPLFKLCFVRPLTTSQNDLRKHSRAHILCQNAYFGLTAMSPPKLHSQHHYVAYRPMYKRHQVTSALIRGFPAYCNNLCQRTDTVKCDGVNLRLMGDGAPYISGFDTPEVRQHADCPLENHLGVMTTAIMSEYLHTNGLVIQESGQVDAFKRPLVVCAYRTVRHLANI